MRVKERGGRRKEEEEGPRGKVREGKCASATKCARVIQGSGPDTTRHDTTHDHGGTVQNPNPSKRRDGLSFFSFLFFLLSPLPVCTRKGPDGVNGTGKGKGKGRKGRVKQLKLNVTEN